jgi:hypothetical protein
MNRAGAACLLLALAGCGGTPMPPPAPGEASKEDAMAPADVAASDRASMPAALPPPDLQPAEPVANDLSSAIADGWVGEWHGPEGTSLRIAKQEVGYQLIVTNLDGAREFHGLAADDVVEFDRDGVVETLRAGDGKATGMKWLAGKRDCLVVKAGEGYCRD